MTNTSHLSHYINNNSSRQNKLQGLEHIMADKMRRTIRQKDTRIILPLPPEHKDEKFEMEIYATFMRYLRVQTNQRYDFKIYGAIESTALFLRYETDIIAKTLVDLGLRAGPSAFPASFLSFCGKAIRNLGKNIKYCPQSILSLYRHWDHIADSSACVDQNKQFQHAQRELETIS